jgi:hypothetical protein
MDMLCWAVIAWGRLAFHATLESATGAQEGEEENDGMGGNDEEDEPPEAEVSVTLWILLQVCTDSVTQQDEEPIPWS